MPASGRSFAERNRGERRLSGAVLADERVNLAGIQIEVDVVDRDDAGKRFADAAQRERRFCAHTLECHRLECGERFARSRAA